MSRPISRARQQSDQSVVRPESSPCTDWFRRGCVTVKYFALSQAAKVQKFKTLGCPISENLPQEKLDRLLLPDRTVNKASHTADETKPRTTQTDCTDGEFRARTARPLPHTRPEFPRAAFTPHENAQLFCPFFSSIVDFGSWLLSPARSNVPPPPVGSVHHRPILVTEPLLPPR